MTANTIKSVLTHARKELASISDSPCLDTELMLAHCLKKNRTYCHTWPEHELTKSELGCFEKAMARRKDDYPVAYILGKKSFWTFEVEVTPDVLIPRPETELLVEVALEKITDIQNPKILDLGTGSGVIALALASERPDASIVACDSSKKALKVATRNAVNLGLNKQIEFIHSIWFEKIIDKDFDMIVSNPPYIASQDKHLKESIRHEPLTALVADKNGIQDIEKIIKDSSSILENECWVIIEHGFDQSVQTQLLFSKYGLTEPLTYKDLNNNPRLTLARYSASTK